MSCQKKNHQPLDIQGHRGWKGAYPENTLIGFQEALKLGVNTLELDVVISKDSQVVVSHEPWFNALFTTLPDGTPLNVSEEMNHNIFQLTYDEIRSYDVGLRTHPKYPNQQAVAAQKPLLKEVIETLENEFKGKKWAYNIEIKRNKDEDGIFNPDAITFTDLVMAIITPFGLKDRITIQSFDHETLIYLKSKYPDYRTAILVGDELGFDYHLNKIGYTPEIYSPYFKLIDENLILQCKAKNMKIIPWTVNEEEDIKNTLKWGVDGIISDYPDIVIEVVKTQNR